MDFTEMNKNNKSTAKKLISVSRDQKKMFFKVDQNGGCHDQSVADNAWGGGGTPKKIG